MKDLKGLVISFKKADLVKLNEGELQVLAVFPHVINRLNMLESHAYSHSNVAMDSSVGPEKRVMAVSAFVESVILVAGELKEAWEALQKYYYGSQLAKAMNPKLPLPIQEMLKRLSGHFKGESLVNFLRNSFAYHNAAEHPKEAMQMLPKDDELHFCVIDEQHLFYEFANRIRIMAIAKRLGVGEWTDVMQPLTSEVMGTVFNDVYVPMSVIVRHVVDKVGWAKSQIIVNLPEERELRADVLFTKDQLP